MSRCEVLGRRRWQNVEKVDLLVRWLPDHPAARLGHFIEEPTECRQHAGRPLSDEHRPIEGALDRHRPTGEPEVRDAMVELSVVALGHPLVVIDLPRRHVVDRRHSIGRRLVLKELNHAPEVDHRRFQHRFRCEGRQSVAEPRYVRQPAVANVGEQGQPTDLVVDVRGHGVEHVRCLALRPHEPTTVRTPAATPGLGSLECLRIKTQAGHLASPSMGRKVDVNDLVGAAEIAERFGWSHPQNVHTIRRRHADFPEPVASLRTALVWSWADVEAWGKATGRLS